MTESKENKELKEKYSKDKYFAVVYLKGGCSNGNTEIDLEDRSAWMYYIEFTSSGESIFGNNVELAKSKYVVNSQDTMSVEAFTNALDRIIKMEKNEKHLLIITDYTALYLGITKSIVDPSSYDDETFWVNQVKKDYSSLFPHSEVLLITKKEKNDYPQFIEGMQKVTEFVNGETKFKKNKNLLRP